MAREIARHALPAPGARLIVALSGGADSVALLAILNALGYDCLAAHCNFGLRGAEADRDTQHAAGIARQLDVDFTVRHFNAAAVAAERHISAEMACRDLRYAWFYDLLESEHAAAIAVGHHHEDQTETFMLNLMRTTGLHGLTGMAYANKLVIRPLLNLSRAQIEDYLDARGLRFVTDSSNSENKYLRNRIRNSVLPAMTEQFPDAGDAILATMANLSDAATLYDYAARTLIRPYIDEARSAIDIGAMLGVMPADVVRMLLYEHLKPLGFNMTQTAAMLGGANSSQHVAGNVRAIVDRGRILVRPTVAGTHPRAVAVRLTTPITEPLHIDITRHDIAEFNPGRNNDIIYLDATVLQPDNDGTAAGFEIRPWQRGDRMQPFGMHGTRLLSDIFADARLDAEAKRDVRILTRNGVILWVIGLRASAHFAVTPDTRTYLRLELRR